LIQEIQSHYTARELTGLPGVPQSVKGVHQKAERENWPSQKRSGKGGGNEYPLSALPPETRDHLVNQAIAQLPEKVCQFPQITQGAEVPALVEKTVLQPVATLKKWQTSTMEARLIIIRLIERAVPSIGATKAIRILVKQAADGTLPDEIQHLVPIANKRSGDGHDRSLSERSLMRWWSSYQKAGGNYAALAPAKVEKEKLPLWAPFFLKAYRVPQKISVAHAIEDMAEQLPAGTTLPTEAQAYRVLAKMSTLDQQRGRMTGKELRSQKGFIRRSTDDLEPLEIVLCDGHSWKGYIAHPVHGRHFKPEVCAIIDAATRVIIGWSAGLAESSQTVADAVRHAVTVSEEKPEGGIPAILYADRGAGNEANVNSDPFCGMYARLGMTYKTGIPGNSQARGLIERVQKTVWIRAAKKLDTYTGPGMDSTVQRKVYLALEKDVKAAVKAGKEGKKSEKLLSWSEFLDFCNDEVADYNRRPHSALPRITDRVTGLRRHMCPLEMWSKFLAEGWTAMVPEPEELDSLFRPHVTVTTRRGEVRVFGNLYYSGDLVHYNGATVIVAYDIHDANRVWVKDQEERLICIARWNANKRDFYPKSVREQAIDDRLNRRKKLKLQQIEEIEAEAAVPLQLVAARELPPEVIAFEQRQEKKEKQKEIAQSCFDNVADLCDDIRRRQKQGGASEYETTWADDYDRSMGSGKRLGLYKIDPNCAGRFAAQAAHGQ